MARDKMFTAIMNHSGTYAAGTDAWSRAVQTVEAQENIYVEALLINVNWFGIDSGMNVAVSDDVLIRAQVSQAAVEEDEGVMGECTHQYLYSLFGAQAQHDPVITSASPQIYIPFVKGFRVMEDGDINLHFFVRNTCSTTVTAAANVILYYTK
jgi:hypothetical protein